MSAIPYPLDPLGKHSPYFEIVVKPGILDKSLTYGFTPYWNTGGYCRVVDWGDGMSEDAVKSGTTLTHTYAASGTYTISIKADCYKCKFGENLTYAPLVYDANGNWDALGNITDGGAMFFSCNNALLSFFTLPKNLVKGSYMFRVCKKALLPITELPETLTEMSTMFYYAHQAHIRISKLPSGIYAVGYAFAQCYKAVINLDELAANAPEGGWTGLTSIESMLTNAGSGNSPGTVTGSRSAFLAKLPNVTSTINAFYGTNTTE